MPCRKEQSILMQVLEKYRDMPLLWQREHQDYLNKEKRIECYKILLKVYLNYEERATIKLLKKKIENMRTNYLKEFKRVLASKYTYTPTLWYYKTLTFLNNDKECKHNESVSESHENLDSSSDDEALANSNSSLQRTKIMDTPLVYEEDEIKCSSETDMAPDDEEFVVYDSKIQHCNETSMPRDRVFQKNGRKVKYSRETDTFRDDDKFESHRPKIKYRRVTGTAHDNEEFKTYEPKVKYVKETNTVPNNEEFEVYGRSVGFQMKDLTKHQLMISQKIISDVLYYAKLEKLSENTCLVLDSSNENVLPNVTKF